MDQSIRNAAALPSTSQPTIEPHTDGHAMPVPPLVLSVHEMNDALATELSVSGDTIYTLDDLLARAGSYLTPAKLELVHKAYEFAEKAHAGQTRRSGEPYITHPLATAMILARLQMDAPVLAASLLHDVPEDTKVDMAELRQEFGDEIATMVDGVTKISKLKLAEIEAKRHLQPVKGREAEVNAWAENLRKMFLAMAENVSVVLIKLADRLHNMRTLQYHSPEKQQAIAKETLEIYAPLANRLGIWEIKSQLEDYSFRYLQPEQYREIAKMLASKRNERQEFINRVVKILNDHLAGAGIKAEISGRPKHIYSIYRKMQRRNLPFSQIYDLLAIRIIVGEIADCYHALGVVHSIWHPIPGQFDDYIAMPKESMYRSLHTTVHGPDMKPLEIQIRTQEMHQEAEFGVAAHWRYKENVKRDSRFEQKVAWLRQLLDWQKELVGAEEFVESVKNDLFQDQVYVFTPKGDIRELPAGATPLDFAYRIHTDIGHRCVGAKINGRLVSLDTPLRTGDVVEIVTTKANRGPSRDWLNPSLGYLKTAHARDKVRQWFKRQHRDENIQRGREMLEKELQRLGIHDIKLEDIAHLLKYEKLEEFFAAIGVGEISLQRIAEQLVQNEQEKQAALQPFELTNLTEEKPEPARSSTSVMVNGMGDMLTKLARCCRPVPGDAIIGYITRGSGVTVHRADCQNIANVAEKERLIQLAWGNTKQELYPVIVQLNAYDRPGLLRDMAIILAEEKININSCSTTTNPNGYATITTTFDVPNISVLSKVMNKLESIKGVQSVHRAGVRQ